MANLLCLLKCLESFSSAMMATGQITNSLSLMGRRESRLLGQNVAYFFKKGLGNPGTLSVIGYSVKTIAKAVGKR